MALGDAASQRDDEQGDQPDNADRHVSAVKPGEDEERRPEHIPLQGEPLVVELGELEVLAADEDRAQQGGRQQPDPQAAMVPALDRAQGQHHRQRAHQEDEGADRGVRNIEDIEWVRRHKQGLGAAPVGQVGRDQGAEEHRVRGEEGPHQQFPAIHAGAGWRVLSMAVPAHLVMAGPMGGLRFNRRRQRRAPF
jgi:hypothetical protein